MKQHVLVAIVGGILGLTGCQQSEESGLEDKVYPVSIEAGIVGSQMVAGRYVGEAPNSVSFTSGDQIGVAMVGGEGFVKWTYNESKWESGNTMTWKNKTEDHTFYAFYPFAENAALASVPMPALTGQEGTMKTVAACDFLVADKTLKCPEDGKVSFTGSDAFEHVSSLVELKLKHAGDLISATIDKISLEGTDIASSTNYNFGSESPVSLEGGSGIHEISADFSENNLMEADKTYYFVVNSGTVSLSGVKLQIKYTDANKSEREVSVTGLNKEADDEFESGKLYSYGITVMSGVLTISGSEIGNWKDGISLDITINGK